MITSSLRSAVEQGGKPAVAHNPGRRRRRVVEDVADDVVGELVAGARLGQQADPQGGLGSTDRFLAAQTEELRDVLDIEGRAGHDRAPQELLHVGSAVRDPRDHRAAQRVGDDNSAIALGEGLQRLEHEQRVALGESHELGDDLGMACLAGQHGDRLRRQGPEMHRDGPSSELRFDRGASVALNGRRDEQTGGSVPTQHEVDELERGRTRVVQVVEDDQQRSPLADRRQERRHRLEGLPPLHLR